MVERRSERSSDDGTAPEIVSSDPGAFPWSVWHERHPPLVTRILDAFPYGPRQRGAVRELLAETLDGVIGPLDREAHDAAVWNGAWDRGHYGKRWTDAPFLWAESFFYRRLQEAVGYFGAGAWQGLDLFAPFKDAELAGETVDRELAALDALESASDDDRTDALLYGSLWGNRADLGFQITAGTADGAGAGENLVADQRAELRALLQDAGDRRGRIVLVADNAGRELIPDLVLIDHLLTTRRAADVVLHVKPYPYYVSDATTADVVAGLRRLARAPGAAGRIGGRLWEAMASGRLVVRAHPFSCAPLPYVDMPAGLRADFGSAALTLLKGDLNYRRLVGDRHWPATTPFGHVTAYFPGPVAVLRTLKSDVVTGMGRTALDALDASGETWRTSGTYALVQVRF